MRTIQRMGAFIAIAMTGLTAFIAQGTPSSTAMTGHTIIIVPKPDPADAPRTPVFNPFFAELMNGYVLLGSSNPYGTASVNVTSTAGDNYSTFFDTSDGAILLPISGNIGSYTLTISTPDGTHFVGEFTI